MSLDKILIKHLDGQDELESKVEEDIETLMSGISISAVIADAESILMEIVEALQARLKDEYYQTAAENGIKLAKDIEEDGDIQVSDSNDPNLNEGVLDGD